MDSSPPPPPRPPSFSSQLSQFKLKMARLKDLRSDSFKEPEDVVRQTRILVSVNNENTKKRFVVLRKESEKGAPRLEYFGNERKFKSNPDQCKRSVLLKECFSINRKSSTKHKYGIALYTNEDCLTLIFDNELEQNTWFGSLLEYSTDPDGNRPGKIYEHVWQVTMSKKGLGETRNMTGIHRLCLTDKSLLLSKVKSRSEESSNDSKETNLPREPYHFKEPSLWMEFPLIIIRRCGHSESVLFFELGRSSCIGPGELWFQTEDTATAQQIHEVILGAMKASKGSQEFGPLPRPRSASTSENSNPTSASRRPTSGGIISPSTIQPSMSSSNSYASIATSSAIRDRCDSLPTRSRTVSEGTSRVLQENTNHQPRPGGMRSSGFWYARTCSYSPPTSNSIMSPSSGACSTTDSAGSSLSVDDYDSLVINGFSSLDYYMPNSQMGRDTSAIPSEPPITEEEILPDDYLTMDSSAQNSSILSDMLAQASSVQTEHHHQQQQLRSALNLSLKTQSSVTSSSPISSPVLAQTGGGNGQTHTDEGYFPMSPVGSIESTGNKSCSTRSSSIVEKSSISSEISNGYVPMTPGQGMSIAGTQKRTVTESGGYLEMTSLSNSLPKSETYLGSSPKPPLYAPPSLSHSSKTILSEEFKLAKVKSYFTPTEDEESLDYIKPVRSYSMGSRPQVYMRNSSLTKLYHNFPQSSRSSRLGLSSHPVHGSGQPQVQQQQQSDGEAIRVRAFSMGSQVPRSGGVDKEKEKRKNSLKESL